MMKYIFLLALMFLFMIFNNLMCFVYNIMFLLGILMLAMKVWNYDMVILISVGSMLDYYSFNLFLMSIWIIGLMFMIISGGMEKKLFLILIVILSLFFMSSNFLLFYLFFEMSLIPVFFIVVYLGYNLERLSSAYYMLMYTLMISLPLLIYIMKLYKIVGSLSFIIMMLSNLMLSFWESFIIMGAFLVKMPMYLVHIWLPKAHVEAPVYGSMILASVLLKLGSYGLLRMLSIFIMSGFKIVSIYISVGLVGMVIVSGLCLVQIDMKSLVAYSSVVHMNMMMCGLLSYYKIGFISAYIIMISHGFCSSGLFYMVNLFYIRSSSRLLMLNKGFLSLLSFFMIMWFLLCVFNISFPLSIGFFGEILLIGVLLKLDSFILIYLFFMMFLSSAYSLYMYLYVFHGSLNLMGKFNSGSVKEALILSYHIIPMVFLLISMNIF